MKKPLTGLFYCASGMFNCPAPADLQSVICINSPLGDIVKIEGSLKFRLQTRTNLTRLVRICNPDLDTCYTITL